MKREAAEILKDALALPTEDRAALAASLLDSLDPHVDEDAEAAWATVINRGVANWKRNAPGDSPASSAASVRAGAASGPQTTARRPGSFSESQAHEKSCTVG
jgi:putative addiction module component